MKANSAIVMSYFKNEVPAGTRINLKWPDKHEVTDFKLDHLGELVSCETETDQTGWVIVKSRGNIQIGDRFLCYRRSTIGSRRGLSIFTAPSES